MPNESTLYDWLGGMPALLRMTKRFYGYYVVNDPLLEPVFADMDPNHPEHVATWLAEVFGGPKTYSAEHGGYNHMVRQHLNRGLTEQQRARWVSLMGLAADDAGPPTDPEFRSAFVSYLEWGSRLALENSQPGATPPMNMPVPRWDWGTAGPPGIRPNGGPSPAGSEPGPSVALPADAVVPSFDVHIRPLFRPMDRQSMKWAFDLWSHTDVSGHAPGILARLQNGSMPCDSAWPAEHVALFRRWIDAGMPA